MNTATPYYSHEWIGKLEEDKGTHTAEQNATHEQNEMKTTNATGMGQNDGNNTTITTD